MKQLALGLLALWVASASASDCPIVYLRGGELSKFDHIAHQVMDGRYHIVDIDPVAHAFVDPKALSGSMPSAPADTDGQPLHGYVLLAYVITSTGQVESPRLVKSTDTRLTALALAATETWRLAPGEADGKAVCVVAIQEFNF
jgi:hypothetical protein